MLFNYYFPAETRSAKSNAGKAISLTGLGLDNPVKR
jgi:hypothetical protein